MSRRGAGRASEAAAVTASPTLDSVRRHLNSNAAKYARAPGCAPGAPVPAPKGRCAPVPRLVLAVRPWRLGRGLTGSSQAWGRWVGTRGPTLTGHWNGVQPSPDARTPQALRPLQAPGEGRRLISSLRDSPIPPSLPWKVKVTRLLDPFSVSWLQCFAPGKADHHVGIAVVPRSLLPYLSFLIKVIFSY